MFPKLAKFCSSPCFGQILGGENPSMPKMYAKHNLIPCGFISATKPAGGSRGQIPQQRVPAAERTAPQNGCSQRSLGWDCPRTAEGSPRLTARSSSVYTLCSRGSVLPLSSCQGHTWLGDQQGLKWQGWGRKQLGLHQPHSLASRVGFSQREP